MRLYITTDQMIHNAAFPPHQWNLKPKMIFKLFFNVFVFFLTECNAEAVSPQAILPEKNSTMARSLEADIAISCFGFFGRGHAHTSSLILWQFERTNASGKIESQFWLSNLIKKDDAPSNINVTYL